MSKTPDDLEALRRRCQPENQPYSAKREDEFKAMFPYLSMSPEEYVARHSHGILCFSFHRFGYRDTRLKLWLQSVYDLLRNRERVKELRRQYLTAAEIEEAERIESNP